MAARRHASVGVCDTALKLVRARLATLKTLSLLNVVQRGYTPALKIALYPRRDWILTRILWLSGLEAGKNRLGQVDTMRRFVYIHSSPDEVEIGKPSSRGCIRMHNRDIMELFEEICLEIKFISAKDRV